MLEKIKELLTSNELIVSDTYPKNIIEDCVTVELRSIQPKNQTVTTYQYELKLFSKESMELAVKKLQQPLFRQILGVNSVGNPSLSVDQEGLKKYKVKDLKMMPYIYSIDVINR
ncbi:hypothetical protein LJB88_02135 [Erysipelotrichaceae bacterium OttesenSCG-928-M19]|nr:hypothetical protein [Erysipelotrichaceae bacterium OttesenSCG-928-M19]